MFACFNCLNNDTSRIAVHGAPSSCSRRISLRATNEPFIVLCPLNTVA
jgi:hypothetical protein